MTGNAALVAAVQRWKNADAAARAWKQEELDARLALVSLAFPQANAGTNSAALGDGTVLKAIMRQNFTVESGPKLDLVLKALPAAIRANLVKFKPDLSVSAYNALEPGHKRIFNEVLTIKPGAPALEIVVPKAVT
jgi:hypothetical protein